MTPLDVTGMSLFCILGQEHVGAGRSTYQILACRHVHHHSIFTQTCSARATIPDVIQLR